MSDPKENNKPYFAHPTVCIDENAEIGDGTKIWHFSHILSDTKIGKNCVIGQNAAIGPKVKVGDGCKIQNNVSLYAGVTLEDEVFIGPSAVFTNVLTPRSFVDRRGEFSRTLVKKGASVGANATIVCGATIGQYAFVGAGAVVTKDVPSYALMVGVPARQKGWVCKCGVPLKGISGKYACPRCFAEYLLEGSVFRCL
ncbi:MAG: N-acetyltransferase [Candidatus Omnitrophica bacterium]|nr:N-acetyltransferase [Candidatus Omnitrophota bacterium]